MLKNASRHLKIPISTFKCQYKNNELISEIPYKTNISVRDYLKDFSKKLPKKKEYHDFEMTQNNKIISFDTLINDLDYEKNQITIIPFDFNREKFFASIGKTTADIQSNFGKQDFFEYVLEYFPEFEIKQNQVIDFVNISLPNLDKIKQTMNERKHQYRNQWMYNKHTFHMVNTYKLQKYEKELHSLFITQILNHFIAWTKTENVYSIDINTLVKGIDTPTLPAEFVIKNKQNNIIFPINLMKPINEVYLYNLVREQLYYTTFTNNYPDFEFEAVNNRKTSQLNEGNLKLADEVSKALGKFLLIFRI
jgi:hypothetical protein